LAAFYLNTSEPWASFVMLGAFFFLRGGFLAGSSALLRGQTRALSLHHMALHLVIIAYPIFRIYFCLFFPPFLLWGSFKTPQTSWSSPSIITDRNGEVLGAARACFARHLQSPGNVAINSSIFDPETSLSISCPLCIGLNAVDLWFKRVNQEEVTELFFFLLPIRF
jgi:hypothetical protein